MSGTESPKPASADFDDWREQLLASLRDCDVQRAPRYPVLRYALAIIVLFVTLIGARFAAAAMFEGLRNAPPPIALGGFGLFFLFLVAVVSRIRNRFLRSAWQSSALTAEQELSRIGSRRPVLYLRSFSLDQAVGRRSWLERYLGTYPFPNAEQQMTVELRKLGPVIAIGRPGEKLPALGAARFYVSHARWQEKVIDVLKCAQLVAWATGVTEGLKWEISHLTGSIHPRRLILWAHPHLLAVSAAKREAEWKRFRETLGTVFPKPLPETLGDARYFVFDADWTPHPVTPRATDAFINPQKSALRRALRLQQNGFDDAEANEPPILDPSVSRSDFGALIGARGPAINWKLLGVYFVSLFAATFVGYLSFLMTIGEFGEFARIGRIVTNMGIAAAISTAAALVAFRGIRSSLLATLAAAALAALVTCFYQGAGARPEGMSSLTFFLARFLPTFVSQFLTLGGLVWMSARGSTLFGSLWFGYFLGELGGTIFRSWSDLIFYRERATSLQGAIACLGYTFQELIQTFPRWLRSPLIEATLFAAMFVIGIKLLPLFMPPVARGKPSQAAPAKSGI